MKIDEKIVGICLYGYIKGESKDEQLRCLNVIEMKYGAKMRRIVNRYLNNLE